MVEGDLRLWRQTRRREKGVDVPESSLQGEVGRRCLRLGWTTCEAGRLNGLRAAQSSGGW